MNLILQIKDFFLKLIERRRLKKRLKELRDRDPYIYK
jgi:hypothetical protein